MLSMLLPLAGTFIASAPDQIRALPAERLAEEARKCLQDITMEQGVSCSTGVHDNQSEIISVVCGGTIQDSLKLACSLCPPDGVICIAGSLYQAGEARRFFKESKMSA